MGESEVGFHLVPREVKPSTIQQIAAPITNMSPIDRHVKGKAINQDHHQRKKSTGLGSWPDMREKK